jgi:hypothetical protein
MGGAMASAESNRSLLQELSDKININGLKEILGGLGQEGKVGLDCHLDHEHHGVTGYYSFNVVSEFMEDNVVAKVRERERERENPPH